ncbi:dihydrofolate reductase [Maylandia zebra]|uniref:dihydrofolate reductase n=3 Tax=Haplochromini TaxID=319058 RepID=A0A3B4H1X8_9CICH|nr:dihydrofolate reductase [Maylandia zebra]XP_005734905.1 PREDICTED: dihydrofolate reductase-like [Pundamilia nyererei]XP_026032340.1 dihydrofolate reductase-like [Astatotilapia calliptera]
METSWEKLQKKPVRLIAAACNDMGIGKDGKLPWDLPTEFQYFMNTVKTVSRPGRMNFMVWGRLCWNSHPESLFPLPNILHVVLSKTLDTVPDHAHFLCRDFDSAIRLAAEPPLADLIETIWIVGGVQLYKDALNHPWCDLLYLTDVMADYDCDVFFPEFDKNLFQLQEGFPGVPSEIQEENGIKFKYQVFKRDTADTV